MTEFRQEFRISVRGLELGMFVSRLDRPWLETPFLMQGFQVATEEEPGDERAEAPSAQAPLVQVRQVGLPPARGEEAEHRHEREQQHEDDRGGDVHGWSPRGTSLRVMKYTNAVITALIKTQSSWYQ